MENQTCSALEELIAIRIEGDWWLGHLIKNQKTVTLTSALEWDGDEDDRYNYISWIKMYNIGGLRTIKITSAKPCVEEPLQTKQRKLLRQLWYNMLEAKSIALARLENDVFDDMC